MLLMPFIKSILILLNQSYLGYRLPLEKNLNSPLYLFCQLFFFSSRRRHTRYIGDWSRRVLFRSEHSGERSDRRRGRGDQERLECLGRCEMAARGADRAPDPDRSEPALDLGAGGGGEHHAGG